MTHPFWPSALAVICFASGDWDAALLLAGMTVLLLAIRKERG